MALQSTHRIPLEHVRVRECMHHGIYTCAPDAPLSHIARTMAKHRVHAVVVTAHGGARPLGLVSDLDVVSATISGEDPRARELAATETLTVSADAPLRRAAQLMSEHCASHLIVVDSAGAYPIGVISTIDIAAVYAEQRP